MVQGIFLVWIVVDLVLMMPPGDISAFKAVTGERGADETQRKDYFLGLLC